MKRLAVILLVAASVFAADKWPDNYKKGVAAVNARNYRLGADLLQKAVAENPTESTSARTGSQIITYVPHFFLGIAKFNLGDVDGALREWRTCEEQGAISRTDYYSNMKDWISRAQAEKVRMAERAASGSKKAADAAINKAMFAKSDAFSQGGDRTESYRSGERKLTEARAQFGKAGTDVAAYKDAEEKAGQASALFAAAADEGKKIKAAQAARPQKKPEIVIVERTDLEILKQQQAKTETAPTPPPVTPPVAPPVDSKAEVDANLAVQQYRRAIGEAVRTSSRETQGLLQRETREGEKLRKRLEGAKSDADFETIRRTAADREKAMTAKLAEIAARQAVVPAVITATASALVTTPATDLRDAYRAYAAGDLTSSEQLLNQLLGKRITGEAYLLRGCTRYTRAMLSRTPEALLASAAADFKAALAQNRALRLDPRAFSPKLVQFFESQRRTR